MDKLIKRIELILDNYEQCEGLDLQNAHIINNGDEKGFTIEYSGGNFPFQIDVKPIAVDIDNKMNALSKVVMLLLATAPDLMFGYMNKERTIGSLVGSIATIGGLLSQKINDEEQQEKESEQE